MLVGVVTVSGIATATQGMRFARQAPGGAVPLEDGDHAAAEATSRQRRAKRRLNALGLVSLAAEAGLVGVNAALEPAELPPAAPAPHAAVAAAVAAQALTSLRRTIHKPAARKTTA